MLTTASEERVLNRYGVSGTVLGAGKPVVSKTEQICHPYWKSRIINT